jgi:hypothetical protein
MVEVITWDWKDPVPLAKILDAYQGMIDYDQVPYYYLPDTGGDYYACILSDLKLIPEDIDRALSEDPMTDSEIKDVVRKYILSNHESGNADGLHEMDAFWSAEASENDMARAYELYQAARVSVTWE